MTDLRNMLLPAAPLGSRWAVADFEDGQRLVLVGRWYGERDLPSQTEAACQRNEKAAADYIRQHPGPWVEDRQ